MTTQQLRAQIAALQDATMDENRNFRSAYDEGKFDALSAVDALLDSMQEEPQVKKLAGLQHVNETCKENGNSLTQEPVNDDLEEAAFSFARKDSEGISNPANFYYTVADKARIFKAGAKWQKEQMMAKAIDGRLCSTICGSEQNVVAYVGYGEYGKDGDKVKVIVIKED